MTKLESKAFKFIRNNHGITLKSLTLLLGKDSSSVKKAIKTLYFEGRISHWHGALYPNYRSIVVYEKGKDEESEEIELVNYLSPKQISKFIKPSEDNDYWFCNNYQIDEKTKILFEKSNNVIFDLDKFEYFLTYTMDNRYDTNKL